MSCPKYWLDAPGKSDPYFVAISATNIPLFVAGVFLNGGLLFLIRKRRKTRLDRVMQLLLAVHLGWSLFEVLRYTVSMFYGPQSFWRVVAMGTWMGLITIFAANMSLSFERCFFVMFSSMPDYEGMTRKYFVALAVWVLALYATIIAVFTTSCSSRLLFPTNRLERVIWTATVGSGGVAIMLLTIVLNLYTYLHVKRAIQTSLGLGITKDLQQKVLVRCIIMSSSLVVMYIPLITFMGVTLVSHLEDSVYRSFRIVSYFLVALDAVVTPGLMIYLHKDVRMVVTDCWRWWCGQPLESDEGKLVRSLSIESEHGSQCSH
ncbi:hypothetical protein BC830DRAFT_380062 [Chytriomyces sp. MP71]|nr:hypothetical protein BC830DRAFT_380062 [Chytriomyces sp. MP71]